MVEFNAWVTICEDIENDEFYIGSDMMNIRGKLLEKISKYEWKDRYIIQLKGLNGYMTLVVSIKENRISDPTEDAFDLIYFISQHAPSSYGLVYFYNDDDPNNREDEFQVFVISNGSVRRKSDPFLSPVY